MKILRIKQVIEILGISRSTFHEWQNQNSKYYKKNFPKKIRLGVRAIGYLEEDINKFLEDLINIDHGEI